MGIEDLSLFAQVLEDLKGQLLTYMLLAFIVVFGIIILTTVVNEMARLRGNEARERLIRQQRGSMDLSPKAVRKTMKTKKPPLPLQNLRAAFTEGENSKT